MPRTAPRSRAMRPGALALGDIHENIHRAHDAPAASRTTDGNAMNGTRVPSGRSGHGFLPFRRRIVLPSRRRHRTLVVRQRRAIGPVHAHEPHHWSVFSLGRQPHKGGGASL